MTAERPLTVELPFAPKVHQRQAHALRLAVRFLVLVWHRRGGKTVFAVVELLLAAVACTKPRGRYGYIAPLLKQAKGVAWDYLKFFARTIPGCVINESELQVELPNGNRIRLFGADNPDAFRGLYFDGLVLDEVADMKAEVWGEILRPAIADRQGWVIFIGTPKGVNLFSELYYRALKGEDGWGADLKRARDTGMITPEELAQARREMTEPQFAQEMDCDFAAAVEDVLITLAAVQAAQTRGADLQAYSFAARVLGVDCARYGGGRSTLCPRQGLVAFTPKILKGVDLMALAAHICQLMDNWSPDAVFVDIGGMGAGVVDRCLQLNHDVIGIDFNGKPLDARYENKRAEMWITMRDWMATGCLPDIPELRQDLPGPRYTYKNARGRMQLESKEDMRARGVPSPDVGDGYALTFAAPVSPRAHFAGVHMDQGNVEHDYDPFDSRRL